MSSPFYEPYRDWDPFIAWNELKERDPALRDSKKESDKRKEAKEN